MTYDRVVILSEDTVFARMLELELAQLQIQAASTARLQSNVQADVLVLDLDSAAAPPPEQYRRLIGFSRHSAMNATDACLCSMILRRPFRMSLFRREVLAQLEQVGSPAVVPIGGFATEKRPILLRKEEQTVMCDGQTVPLTPTELSIMEYLLAHRGEAVSRAVLAEVVGCSRNGNEIDVYICYLRRKTDGLSSGRLIRTVRGKGYQIL